MGMLHLEQTKRLLRVCVVRGHLGEIVLLASTTTEEAESSEEAVIKAAAWAAKFGEKSHPS